MIEQPSKLQPVLIGGLVLGLGSVIPVLSFLNVCCCGWSIIGGALAAYLLIRRSSVLPITSSDGAGAGALAGVVGSFINLIIGVPLTLLRWNSTLATLQQRTDAFPDAAARETVRQITDIMQSHPALVALGSWLLFAVLSVGMAALGGVIGVAMFEKRKGQPPSQPFPPADPPPSYGARPAAPETHRPPDQHPRADTEPPTNQ
jgi:hypothetical protein